MRKLDLHSIWMIMYYNYLASDFNDAKDRIYACESAKEASYEIFSETIAIITLNESSCYFVAENGYIKSSEEIPYSYLMDNK